MSTFGTPHIAKWINIFQSFASKSILSNKLTPTFGVWKTVRAYLPLASSASNTAFNLAFSAYTRSSSNAFLLGQA